MPKHSFKPISRSDLASNAHSSYINYHSSLDSRYQDHSSLSFGNFNFNRNDFIQNTSTKQNSLALKVTKSELLAIQRFKTNSVLLESFFYRKRTDKEKPAKNQYLDSNVCSKIKHPHCGFDRNTSENRIYNIANNSNLQAKKSSRNGTQKSYARIREEISYKHSFLDENFKSHHSVPDDTSERYLYTTSGFPSQVVRVNKNKLTKPLQSLKDLHKHQEFEEIKSANDSLRLPKSKPCKVKLGFHQNKITVETIPNEL